MKVHRWMGWLALLNSIGLLILPKVVPFCTAGTLENPMRCYFTYQAQFLIALLAVILSGSLLAAKSREAYSLAAFIVFMLGLIVVIIPQPWVIGICETEGAACHKTTFFANILGIALAVEGLTAAWMGRNFDWRATDQDDEGEEE